MAARQQVTFITTLDFDAETVWMQAAQRGPFHGPSYESQGTFGPKVGVWRLLDVLARNEVPATFFVPGWVAERWPAQVEAVVRAGHEVALHGYLHEYPNDFVSVEEEEMILLRGADALRKLTGTFPVGYRPPGYLYTNNTLGVLRRHGFVYGSAMHDDDAAYVHDGPGEGIVEIPVLWHLADDMFGSHMDVRLPPSQVEEHWSTELAELGRYEKRVFVPTLHPQVTGHPGRLAMFERVLALGRELDVRFARCVDVATEVSQSAKFGKGDDPD
jgi:peptidoglycan-N-acetylglucosamine deacetylase